MIGKQLQRLGNKFFNRSVFFSPIKRNFTVRTLSQSARHTRHRTFALTTSGVLLSLGIYEWKVLENDSNLKDEPASSINVDKSVSPFPTILAPPEYPLTTNYALLGYGTRSVTFINFKVYALGIYVAQDDLKLIPKILSTNFLSTAFIDTDNTRSHAENVEAALKDDQKSRVLVSNLIDAGVRMVAKITPIRNTDFNHLKEGLIKSILKHPDAKKDQEKLSRGLQELKDAFIRKGSVPKNDDLLLELQANGSLQMYYWSRKSKKMIELGRVDEPFIGKLLFSEYLSGPKPLSKGTRDTFVSKISKMV